jgi:hypothetical protein
MVDGVDGVHGSGSSGNGDRTAYLVTEYSRIGIAYWIFSTNWPPMDYLNW